MKVIDLGWMTLQTKVRIQHIPEISTSWDLVLMFARTETNSRCFSAPLTEKDDAWSHIDIFLVILA